MSKKISEWRKEAPRTKKLQEDRIGKFRENAKLILQHGIHSHGWEEILDGFCKRAEEDVKSAKEYIQKVEKENEEVSPNLRDRLIYLLNSYSREKY
ncbi:MAG: hypothetical protein R6U26_02715 [Candidatus Undinarchaeales archaeon]